MSWQHVIESGLGTMAGLLCWVAGRRAGAFVFQHTVIRILAARRLRQRLR